MKLSIKIIIFLFLINLNEQVYCQLPVDTVQSFLPPQTLIDSTTKADANLLVKAKAKEVICFHINHGIEIPGTNETIPGFANRYILDNSYILFFQDNRWIIIRYVTLISSNLSSDTVLKSQPLILAENSSLDLLHKKFFNTLPEEVLPFVLKTKRNSFNGFNIVAQSHSRTYRIELFAKDYYDRKFIDILSFEKQINFPTERITNENFNYNHSLNIYFIYKTLDNLSSKMEKQFKF